MFCMWCGAAFGNVEALLEHISAHHGPTSSSSGGAVSSSAPSSSSRKASREAAPLVGAPLNCSFCDKVFHPRSLKRHVRECHRPEGKQLCDQCGQQFANKRTLLQHVRNLHSSRVKVKCARCSRTFNGPYGLKVHTRLQRCDHRLKHYKCRLSRQKFETLKSLYVHRRSTHTKQYRLACSACWRRFVSHVSHLQHIRVCAKSKEKRERFEKLRSTKVICDREDEWQMTSAISGYARVHTLKVTSENDLQLTLIHNKENIESVLKTDMRDLYQIKWYLCAHIQVEVGEGKDETDNIRYMRCAPLTTLMSHELKQQVQESFPGVINTFDHAVDEGSRILFQKVDVLELRVAKYSPLERSSYLPLPNWLKHSRKGLINIKNFNDNKCFLYSVLAGVSLPEIHPERVAKYAHRMRELDMTGIKFPVRVRDISKFEEQNQHISVSVFARAEKRSIVPLRVSQCATRRPHHINLLLLRANDGPDNHGDDDDDSDEDDDETHYVLIKDLSRFLAHLTNYNSRLYWCENCLTCCKSLDKHLEHRERCIHFGSQAVKLPEEFVNDDMRFTDFALSASY